MLADISVITFAVDRPIHLARCIESVCLQQSDLTIHQFVFSERVQELRDHEALHLWQEKVTWVALAGEPFQGNSSARMARLRQAAVEQMKSPYVSFLDDDNTIEPQHFDHLHRLIQSDGLDAAYSWRKIFNPDGTPFPCDIYPWCEDPDKAKQLHAYCVQAGIMTPGQNVVRDGPAPDEDPHGIATIDMNEWLFATSVLQRLGFEDQFNLAEQRARVGEDDKLFDRVRQSGIRYSGTQQPTVNYYLGGVSNLRTTSGPTQESGRS
jgi:hypothetical protein